jgi:hypothetical protein
LSNDSRFLDEECLADLTHLAAAAVIPSGESKVMEQIAVLMKELSTNPIMLADVLLYAMKSNADKKHVQIYCLEGMHISSENASSTVSVSVVLGMGSMFGQEQTHIF